MTSSNDWTTVPEDGTATWHERMAMELEGCASMVVVDCIATSNGWTMLSKHGATTSQKRMATEPVNCASMVMVDCISTSTQRTTVPEDGTMELAEQISPERSATIARSYLLSVGPCYYRGRRLIRCDHSFYGGGSELKHGEMSGVNLGHELIWDLSL